MRASLTGRVVHYCRQRRVRPGMANHRVLRTASNPGSEAEPVGAVADPSRSVQNPHDGAA